MGTGTGIVTVEGKGGGGEERPRVCVGRGRSFSAETERTAGLGAALPTPGGAVTRHIRDVGPGPPVGLGPRVPGDLAGGRRPGDHPAPPFGRPSRRGLTAADPARASPRFASSEPGRFGPVI